MVLSINTISGDERQQTDKCDCLEIQNSLGCVRQIKLCAEEAAEKPFLVVADATSKTNEKIVLEPQAYSSGPPIVCQIDQVVEKTTAICFLMSTTS
jgi:hypothetical protein